MENRANPETVPAGAEITTLGGGCFWCLEAVFDRMEGVLNVESGYAGGHVPNPTYEQVCSAATGHAEVVRIAYDSSRVSYQELLEVFFAIHDPTTLNRQGNDVGPQYRSVIFYHDEAQKTAAEQMMAELAAQRVWPAPIVTELAPAGIFYPAEDYHRDYFEHHPHQPYCQFVVAPKIAKFRQKFADREKPGQQ